MSREAAEIVPVLRGVLHLYAFWAAVAATAALVLLAPAGQARVASLVYGGGMCALFAVSATYHRWRWDPDWRPLLRRLDHSMIFVFIAASYTPVALLGLGGAWRWAILAAVWTGALLGVALSIGWPAAPRSLTSACYLAVGWVAAAAIPELVARLDAAPLLLLGLGGLLYTAGAVVYATQRPDPWPATFGFHEVFHALVVAAVVAQFAAIAGWIVPAG